MLPDRATFRVFAFATPFLALLCLGVLRAEAEPQCVASFREIKFPDGSARVKHYICKTEGSAQPEIRIEFDRLSEAAAGSLVQGTPFPDMELAFGNVRLINNAVTAETKKIFDQFGIKMVSDHYCYSFEVSTAKGGEGHVTSGACAEQRTVWSLSRGSIDMPVVSDLKRYQTSDRWPEGYSFVYSDCSSRLDLIGCTSIWRGARSSDAANYLSDMKAYNRLLGLDSESTSEMEEIYGQDLKYFGLVNYLAGDNWPDDFVVITGQFEGCTDINFTLYPRALILDVAFIENVSNNDMSIDGLLGSEKGSAQLRKAVSGTGSPSGEIAVEAGQLQPGETIAVPLAITFMAEGFGDQAQSEKVFKRIWATKPGTVFQSTGSVRKVREGFSPPRIFKPATYAFGPELRLSGLVIDGKRIVFDQASRNFMHLASFAEEGSCPYLYSWDDDQTTWVNHGKVIHVANGKNKEMTETRTFEGFRSKFRLAEEELEISYIDHVKLEVEMKGGGGMTLKPDFAAMNAKDGTYAKIKAGHRIEFSFALPSSIKSTNVKQSTLAITGYYRRYSDLLMARQ